VNQSLSLSGYMGVNRDHWTSYNTFARLQTQDHHTAQSAEVILAKQD